MIYFFFSSIGRGLAQPNKSSNPPELGFCWAGEEAVLFDEPHRLAIVFSLSISAIVFLPDVAGLLPPADESEVFQRSSNPPNPPAELFVVVVTGGFAATCP
jgi:hypothetical protein